MNTIARVSTPSREEFEQRYVAGSQPVIFTDALRGWRALERWNEEYFRSGPASHRKVHVEHYPQGNAYRFPLWEERPVRELSLGEYMGVIDSPESSRNYVADIDIKEYIPELWADLEILALFDRYLLSKTGLFLGRDTVDPTHCHPNMQVLLCQVVGRKRVTLVRPEAGELLAPAPWYSPSFNWSTLDLTDPAARAALGRAEPIEVVLEPGEALFIPVQWWNLMEGEGFNASVCLLWSASLRAWPFPKSGLRVLAAALVNNGVVGPLVAKARQRLTGA